MKKIRAKIISLASGFKRPWSSWSWYDIVTIKELNPDIEFLDWDSTEDYDFILWYNSQINRTWWIINANWDVKWEMLTDTDKPIIYFMVDTAIYPKDQSELINYKFKANLKKLDWGKVTMYHYWNDNEEMQHYVSRKFDWIDIPLGNYYWEDLATMYYFDEKLIMPSTKDICYIWNHRSWKRTKFINEMLSKGVNLELYWGWSNTELEKINWIYSYNTRILQTTTNEILNDYFGQLCTYDRNAIPMKVWVSRIWQSVAAWCLPIIDERFKYYLSVDLPIYSDSDFKSITQDKRREIIEELRGERKRRLNSVKTLSSIYNLIK